MLHRENDTLGFNIIGGRPNQVTTKVTVGYFDLLPVTIYMLVIKELLSMTVGMESAPEIEELCIIRCNWSHWFEDILL